MAAISSYFLIKRKETKAELFRSGILIIYVIFVAQYIPNEYLPLEIMNVFTHNSAVVQEKLYIGEELNLSEDNQSKKFVKWKSTDEDIVTVDNSGRVTALAEGTADI